MEDVNNFNEVNFNTFVKKINLAIYETIHKTAPVIEKKINIKWNSKPLINWNIINKIKIRDEAYYRAKLTKCNQDLINYKQLKN